MSDGVRKKLSMRHGVGVAARIVEVGSDVAGLRRDPGWGKRSVAASWRGSASSTVATFGRYCARKNDATTTLR
jgi:hypothetical protein